MKKLLSVILSVILVIAMFSFNPVVVNAATIDNATFSSQIASLKTRFRSGEYWNAYNSCGYEGTGLTKCPSCSGYCRGDCPDSCGQFYYYGSWISGQCLGWACKMGNAIFGGNPLTWNVHYNASNLKPGDIIYGNLTSVISGASIHAIFITNISGETVTYADCNSIGPCMVKWDRTTTLSAIRTATSRGAKIYHASNNVVTSGSSVSLVTPTITFSKSSYTQGDTINISWNASPANSNLSHYWITIYNPDGSVYADQGLQKNTSFSFKAVNIGSYRVKVFATPIGSQSGEGSLTDTKTITVNAAHTTHSYSNDCDATCNVCGALRSTNHRWAPADCTSPATCYICYATIGAARGHTYSNDCDKSCNVCGKTRTVGAHKYSNRCDTSCNVCKSTRTVTHTYKTTTTKATLSKNGSIVKKCTICGNVASNTTIKYAKTFTLSTTSYTYNGKVKTPSVTVKDSAGKTLKKGTDYTVTYSSGRKNVGTYKVTIKMIGKYSGTKTLTFKINPASLSSIKLSATSYSYNGKVKAPTVTVKNAGGSKLVQDTNYVVLYQTGRKNVGTYRVAVMGIGNYTGMKTLTFKINPPTTTISKLTAGTKSITVALNKKSTQVTGYQIQYSTSKTFSKATTKTISSYNTTKYTLKSLSAKKTYYVRVRTYKKVGGSTYYSSWSSYKYVKTK